MIDTPSIETSALGRIYKIRGAKKGEQKELTAQSWLGWRWYLACWRCSYSGCAIKRLKSAV